MLAPFLDDAPRRLEHDHDRSLVVRPEDGPGGVPHDSVLTHDRLYDRLGRDGIRVRAQEDRHAGTRRRRNPAVDVPRVTVESSGGGVLLMLEPELREVRRDSVGDGAFLRRRARNRAQLEEEIEERRPQRLLDDAHRVTVQPRVRLGRNTQAMRLLTIGNGGDPGPPTRSGRKRCSVPPPSPSTEPGAALCRSSSAGRRSGRQPRARPSALECRGDELAKERRRAGGP